MCHPLSLFNNMIEIAEATHISYLTKEVLKNKLEANGLPYISIHISINIDYFKLITPKLTLLKYDSKMRTFRRKLKAKIYAFIEYTFNKCQLPINTIYNLSLKKCEIPNCGIYIYIFEDCVPLQSG